MENLTMRRSGLAGVCLFILFACPLTRGANAPATAPSTQAALTVAAPIESIRRPFAAVPLSNGISVDGDIRKGEWTAFTKLHDFVSTMDQSDDNGCAAPEQTEVFVTY